MVSKFRTRRPHGSLQDEYLQPRLTEGAKQPDPSYRPPPAPQPTRREVTLVDAVLEHAAAVRELARAIREVRIDESITVTLKQD